MINFRWGQAASQASGPHGLFQGGLRKGKGRPGKRRPLGSVGRSTPTPVATLPYSAPPPPSQPGETERLSGSGGQRFVSHATPAKDNVAVTLVHHTQESLHLP